MRLGALRATSPSCRHCSALRITQNSISRRRRLVGVGFGRRSYLLDVCSQVLAIPCPLFLHCARIIPGERNMQKIDFRKLLGFETVAGCDFRAELAQSLERK